MAALDSPNTGIVDVPELVTALVGDIEAHAGRLVCRTPVQSVARIDGDSGAVRWSRIVPGRAPARGLALALDAAGDVLVGGAGSMARRGEDLVALKLRGKDGRLRWRRFVDGGGRGDDRAQAMALDAAGNAVAAGVLSAPDGVGDFAAVRFDGRTGRWR